MLSYFLPTFIDLIKRLATMKKLNNDLRYYLMCPYTASFAKPATEASVEKALKLGDIKGTLAQSQQEMRPVYDQQAEEIIKNIFKTSTLNTEQQKQPSKSLKSRHHLAVN
jgi:hypothetical protein